MIIDWKNITPKTYYIPVGPKPADKAPSSPKTPTRSK
jgi:hypothetical protein